ncbi:MAG: cell division protein ZapE [Coxiellaceae bacterium]|nr:cell division protein ZapE [Coxiellaceae bacterium]
MTPLKTLQQKIDQGEITEDPRQMEIMQQLQTLYDELIKQQNQGLLTKIGLKKPKPIKGIYLWGHVGTGKSFLIDMFYSCLPFENKLRIHFHAFMQRIHRELKTLQGHKDPLKLLAKKIAGETCILCFDEFFVSDIADAMLLAGLLEALFANGVCLVTNSNCAPDELYKNGMLRERFIPAIELIKQNTTVINIQTQHDYRLRHLLEAGVYYTPLNDKAHDEMLQSFKHYSKGKVSSDEKIIVLDRPIEVIKASDKTIWFDFPAICGLPRSQNDYLELAKIYNTVLVSNVPIIGERQEDLITTFVKLVDVFYDERIRLVLSAAADAESLYPKGPMEFEYRRTASRLIEMQSKDYFDESLTDHLV